MNHDINPASRELVGASGRYSLVRRLGPGGMASVFLARRIGAQAFEQDVALKFIRPELAIQPEFVEWFIGEARLGGYLSRHDNIVKTLDFVEYFDTYFLVMEYVDGPTLGEVIKTLREQGQTLPSDMMLEVLIQICQGLSYAHEAVDGQGRPLRLIHRDLKPSNILISRSGVVKIADFGIARAESNPLHTMVTGVTKGTVKYMSPEQARGLRTLDQRSDLFTMGLIAYELVTLERFYTAETVEDLKQTEHTVLLQARLEALPTGPLRPQLIRFLQRALEAEPSDRFQTAAEMQTQLEELLTAVPQRRRLPSWLASIGFGPRTRAGESEQPTVPSGPGMSSGPAGGRSDPRAATLSVSPSGPSYGSRVPPQTETFPPARPARLTHFPGDGPAEPAPVQVPPTGSASMQIPETEPAPRQDARSAPVPPTGPASLQIPPTEPASMRIPPTETGPRPGATPGPELLQQPDHATKSPRTSPSLNGGGFGGQPQHGAESSAPPAGLESPEPTQAPVRPVALPRFDARYLAAVGMGAVLLAAAWLLRPVPPATEPTQEARPAATQSPVHQTAAVTGARPEAVPPPPAAVKPTKTVRHDKAPRTAPASTPPPRTEEKLEPDPVSTTPVAPPSRRAPSSTRTGPTGGLVTAGWPASGAELEVRDASDRLVKKGREQLILEGLPEGEYVLIFRSRQGVELSHTVSVQASTTLHCVGNFADEEVDCR